MSDLDDALDSSTPMLHPVVITAEWEELPPGYSSATNSLDHLTDLGQQIGPTGYTVSQSLDDGLPDPVTMTGSNDAGGTLAADLVGRPANIADIWAWRTTPASGNGTGTAIAVTPPGDTAFYDYVIAAIAVDGAATVTQNNVDPDDPNDWKLLKSQLDGTLQLHVFGRRYYVGAPGLSLTLGASLPWSWIAGSAGAQTHIPAQGIVPMIPGNAVGASESVSQTTHTLPAQTLPGRGYTVGVFVTTGSLTWTPGGDGIEVTEVGASPRLQLTRSPVRTEPGGDYVMTSVTSGATSSVAMVGIPLVIGDRPAMDAMEYFSPFNRASPVVDFERDTAPLTSELPVVTASGIISTPIFKGRMAGIDIKGRLAEVQGVSKTRLDLDKSLVLPPINAWREGLTTDWVAAYLMAQGGQYVGVAPTPQTRQWVPFYGSIHPFLGGMWTYPQGYEYIGGVETPWRPLPPAVPGPFVTGMYAQQQNLLSQNIRVQFDDQPPLSGLPGMEGEYNDMMSQANNIGRFSVWLRGDPSTAAPTSVGGYHSLLFEYRMEVQSSYTGGVILGGVQFQVLGTGQIRLRMGNSAGGYSTLDLTPQFLPQDGDWHFLGVAWDFALEEIDVRMDNIVWNTSAWTTNTATLPVTEAAMRASGGYIYSVVQSKLPISEFQAEFGPTMYSEGLNRFWPSPLTPSQNATFRPTNQPLEALAEDTPIQGWPTLTELARATLSHYRTNESDNFEFLPLSYFGEIEQMTPTVVADTQVNAAELDVVRDPTKTRNVVTLEYDEVRVDSKLSRVLTLTDSIEIPRGVTTFIFPLDIVSVELQGALLPYTSDPIDYIYVQKLAADQIAGTATISTDRNFMTVNTKPDGSGTNWNKTTITAIIVGYTSSTVTIKFTNSDASTLYLANSGQDVPHLCILGYAVRSAPAYTTTRDSASVRKRGERALTSQMAWIQSRDVAETTASQLLNILSRPRDEVQVEVMGDPRRTPGQLVTLADSDGTKAEGDWRILSIVHKGNGPMYVQDLQLVRVLPVGGWDGPDGWDQASWAE